MAAGLSTADRAQLARCAWQRQQGCGNRARAHREFETVALWTASGSRPEPSAPTADASQGRFNAGLIS